MAGQIASQAATLGCDGVIVSNHGGRQLDGAQAPVDALPAVVAAVPQGFMILMDGGIRRGTDVLKARALGAHCVLVGRPAMYGLAAGGQQGVERSLELLRQEIDVDLALLGCPDIGMLDRTYLAKDNEVEL